MIYGSVYISQKNQKHKKPKAPKNKHVPDIVIYYVFLHSNYLLWFFSDYELFQYFSQYRQQFIAICDQIIFFCILHNQTYSWNVNHYMKYFYKKLNWIL